METDTEKKTYQTIKTSLKSVVRHQSVITKLSEATLMMHRITTHTLQFLKLYLIHCYENHEPFPCIDRAFVTAVMKTLCAPPKNGRKPKSDTVALKTQLRHFFQTHYAPLVSPNEVLSYKRLNTALDYMAIEIITMYENNIKLRFVDYVERFVNVQWRKKETIEQLSAQNGTKEERKACVDAFCRELRKVKQDLQSPRATKKSPGSYHTWIDMMQTRILPQRQFKGGHIAYDIQVSPQDYLPGMFYMVTTMEASDAKFSNVCPLRTELIPKHFRVDTVTLLYLCVGLYTMLEVL